MRVAAGWIEQIYTHMANKTLLVRHKWLGFIDASLDTIGIG